MLTKNVKRNIGQLKHRVKFESFTTTTTPTGGTTQTWVEIDTRWANVRPISGHERRQINSLQSEVSHVVIVRYDADLVTNEMRAIFQTRIFNIKYPINLGEDDFFLELAASEQVGDNV